MEGFAGESVIYIIKVEISTHCGDKRVIVATLGKGEFFGETALLASEPTPNTAKALTFGQLTVVDASVLRRNSNAYHPCFAMYRSYNSPSHQKER